MKPASLQAGYGKTRSINGNAVTKLGTIQLKAGFDDQLHGPITGLYGLQRSQTFYDACKHIDPTECSLLDIKHEADAACLSPKILT